MIAVSEHWVLLQEGTGTRLETEAGTGFGIPLRESTRITSDPAGSCRTSLTWVTKHPNVRNILKEAGWKSISLKQITLALENLLKLGSDAPISIGLIPIETSVFARVHPMLFKVNRFNVFRENSFSNHLSQPSIHLTNQTSNNENDQLESIDFPPIFKILFHKTKSQRSIHIQQEVLEIISASTYISIERIDPDLPLSDIGLDSLMAMEIRRKISDKLSVTIPAGELLQQISLTNLINNWITQIENKLSQLQQSNKNTVISSSLPINSDMTNNINNDNILNLESQHAVKNLNANLTNFNVNIEERNQQPIFLIFVGETKQTVQLQIENAISQLQSSEFNWNVYANWAVQQIAYVQTLPPEKCIYRTTVIAHMTQVINELQKILNSSKSITQVQLIDGKQTTPFQICYLFSGQGSQYFGMGKGLNLIPYFDLYLNDMLDSIEDAEFRVQINELLFSNEKINDSHMKMLSDRLQNTVYSQTTLFALELALTALWRRYGIYPNLLIGHSLGELSAATSSCAGIFSLRGSEFLSSTHEASSAMKLVLERAKLMSKQMIGSMIGISIGRSEVEQFLVENHLQNKLYVSLDNAIDSCVVGGDIDNVKDLEKLLIEKGIHCSKLYTNHAFHSPMMQSGADQFHKILENFINENKSIYLPTISNVPILSNVTGTWIEPGQLSNPNYFTTHMVSMVRFTECIELALEWANKNFDKKTIFLEIGPGDVLSKLLLRTARQKFKDSSNFITLSSTPSRSKVVKEQANDLIDARIYFLKSLAHLWCMGINIRFDTILEDFYNSLFTLNRSLNYQFSMAQERILKILRDGSISKSKRLIDNSAFHISLTIQLQDNQQLQFVEYVLKQIIQRHETLKYRLDFIHNNISATINSQEITRPIDLSYLELDDDRLLQTINDLTFAVFDLYSGPLIRAVVLKLKKSPKQILHITLHHLITDELSISILLNDLKILLTGNIISDISSSENFNSLVIKQNSVIKLTQKQNEMVINNPAFIYTDQALTWINISNENTEIHLRSDAIILPISFSNNLLTKLKDISKTMETSAAVVAVASLILTLSRFASCRAKEVDTIALGLQNFNRIWNNQTVSESIAAENCVGSFVNTLIIQIQLQEYFDQPFSLLAKKVESSIVTAMEDGIPISWLEQKLFKSKKSSIQTICNYHSHPESIDNDMIVVREPWTVFDIEFQLFEEESELTGWIRFRKVLFSIDLITALANSYVSILSQIIKAHNVKLKDTRSFSTSCIPQIISLWENTRKMAISKSLACTPTDENAENLYLLHRRFETIAESEEFANRIAIRDVYDVNESLIRTLSYRELLRMARVISISLNINPGEPVGVYMERNPKAVASYLGVMMAGGAYMALDTKIFPYERLAYVCDNTGTRYIITLQIYREQVSELVSTNNRIKILFADELLENDNLNNDNLCSKSIKNNIFNDHNPAYICYTSGSTGHPKGVPVTHLNVTTFFDCSNQEWKFNSNSSIIWFHSPSFDLSGWEMWGALLYGGMLTIVSSDILNSSADLWKCLQQFQITHLSQTPAAFYEFCHYDHSQKENLQTLTMVMLCGDSLIFSQSDLKNFIIRYGDKESSISVVNSYGTTESTIINSYRRVTIPDVTTNIPSTSRIGTALMNSQFLILDDTLQPVPPGVPGEMFIAGPCISQGYVFNEKATKDRFSSDNDLILPAFRQYSLSQRNLLNLYQTGDIVRFDAASCDFEFLGRMAHNIKYNGHRLDIIEIEAAVNKLSEVKSSVVVIVELDTRSLLVAYVQIQDSIAPNKLNINSMRQKLARMLPDVLVPTRIIPITSFPLTANKKNDRKLLSTFEAMKKFESNTNDNTDI